MKQVLTTINSLVHSFPFRRSICQPRSFSKYCIVLLLAAIAMLIGGCTKEDHNCKKTVPLIAVFQVTLKNIQASTDVLPELDSVTGKGKGTPIGISTFMGLAQYAPPLFNLAGDETITSENGDQIFATVQGPGPDIDFKTGNIVLKYHATITGGTGRYTDATGSWNTIAHANLNTPTGTDSLKGSITY